MTRFRLTIEYDGTEFVGWQRQDNGRSVQQALEEAIARFEVATPQVFGAGRTDAGVHAIGQVAHVDLSRDITTEKLREAINFHLKPAPIAVLEAVAVSEEFHARFSAKKRHYLYRMIDRRPPLTFERGLIWRVPRPLDVGAMQQAAQALVGKHDFTTFRAAHCQAKSPIKTLDAISVSRQGEEIHVTTQARSFLHNQVRSMVGSLVEVGAGRWQTGKLATALSAADRRDCGPVAPAHGLYLTAVDYDD